VGLLGFQHPGFHSTRIDDIGGARTAVKHLLALGHRRIGLVGGDTADPMRFTPPLHRRYGYLHALRQAGVGVDPELEVLGYFTVDGGEQAMRALLQLSERPTAVFAESDEMAYGAMRAIRRAGLKLPEDIAIIGFDDHASAELMDLSTVRQPVVQQATDLARRVLEAIGAHTFNSVATTLPTELVIRGSTDRAKSVY
jgi:DNA-binding LacI/PurR family transcriptional regulator